MGIKKMNAHEALWHDSKVFIETVCTQNFKGRVENNRMKQLRLES